MPISNQTFAQQTRSDLQSRHRETTEVKDVLTGAGFKKTEPQYTSQPDIQKTEIQHQVLCHDYDKFQDHTILYGKKGNLRDQDPEMSKILAWGEYDPPVKNDFTNNKCAFQEKYKINKMGVEFISEKQDNFRNPQKKQKVTKNEQIVDYIQNENQTLIKNKIYNNLVDKDHMANFSTEYRDQTAKHDKKLRNSQSLHQFYDGVTVAGKARYLIGTGSQHPIVSPEEFKGQQLESKIRDVWRVVECDPVLVRPATQKSDNELLDVKNQKSLLSNMTSQTGQKAAMQAEAQQILDQQNRELNDEQKLELQNKLKELKLTSRWLPDSSLTTYFGKPAFHPYGNGNTKPTYGGTVYGQYMKSHNITPHAGGNKPEHSQVHGRALLGGTVQVRAPGSRSAKKYPVKMTRKPIPPRIAPNKKQVPTEVLKTQLKARNPVNPQTFKEAQARELTILPPTFNEKHLQTKYQKDDGGYSVKEAQKSQHQPSAGGRSNKNLKNDGAGSDQKSRQLSDKNTGLGSEEHFEDMDGRSGQVQDISDGQHEQQSNAISNSPGAQGTQNAPYCEVHGGNEATTVEFLHLNDPKNYKFLPPQFTTQIRAAGRITSKSEGVNNLFAFDP